MNVIIFNESYSFQQIIYTLGIAQIPCKLKYKSVLQPQG